MSRPGTGGRCWARLAAERGLQFVCVQTLKPRGIVRHLSALDMRKRWKDLFLWAVPCDPSAICSMRPHVRERPLLVAIDEPTDDCAPDLGSANDSSLRPAHVDGPVSEEGGSWTRTVLLDAIDSGQRMRYSFLARSRMMLADSRSEPCQR